MIEELTEKQKLILTMQFRQFKKALVNLNLAIPESFKEAMGFDYKGFRKMLVAFDAFIASPSNDSFAYICEFEPNLVYFLTDIEELR